MPRGDGGNIRQDAGGALALCCAVFLCYLGKDDHLAGQYKAQGAGGAKEVKHGVGVHQYVAHPTVLLLILLGL